jgi:hypothetical protein
VKTPAALPLARHALLTEFGDQPSRAVIAYAISLSTDSLCISWLVVFQGNLRLDHDAEKEL